MLGWNRKYNGDSGEGIMELFERRGKEIYQDVFVLLVSYHNMEEMRGMG